MQTPNAKLQEDTSSGNMSALEKISHDYGRMEEEGSISSVSTEVNSKMKDLNSKLEKKRQSFVNMEDEFGDKEGQDSLVFSTLKMRAGEISEAFKLLTSEEDHDSLSDLLFKRLERVKENIRIIHEAFSQKNWEMVLEKCDKALEDMDLFPQLHVYKALSFLNLQNDKEALIELQEAVVCLVKKLPSHFKDEQKNIEDNFLKVISNVSKEQCAKILNDELDQLKKLEKEKTDGVKYLKAAVSLFEEQYEPSRKEKMERIKLLKGKNEKTMISDLEKLCTEKACSGEEEETGK